MERGIVSWFDPVKNFGFIIPDTKHPGAKDIFVHGSSVLKPEGPLEKGERVEFEIADGTKGPEAKNVNVIPLEE